MDRNLKFLENLDQEKLDVLSNIIATKGGFTSDLSEDGEYDAEDIELEFRKYGTNTLVNVFGGNQNSYREILEDVADSMDICYSYDDSVKEIESEIIEDVLDKTLDEMSEDEIDDLYSKMTEKMSASEILKLTNEYGSSKAALLIAIYRGGGFASYKLIVIIANGIAKLLLGQGLSLAANSALTFIASKIVGSIGMAITAAWTLYDITSPAKRVIVPVTIMIALFRKQYQYEKRSKRNKK